MNTDLGNVTVKMNYTPTVRLHEILKSVCHSEEYWDYYREERGLLNSVEKREWEEDHNQHTNKPLPVLTKTDFVKRYSQGEFGNRSPTWDTFEEWCLAHLGGDKLEKFHIRNRIVGAMTWYDVCKYEMADRWAVATKHFEPSQLYISAMCPTERTIFQGEVMRSNRSLELHYSTIKKPMRDALRERSKSVSGIIAVLTLRELMPTKDHEWLMQLLDRYEDHVVEFTTLEVEWGTVPGYHTLYWECRKY